MKKLFSKARYLLALVSLVLLGTNVALAQQTKVYEYMNAPALNTNNYFTGTLTSVFGISGVSVTIADGTSKNVTQAVKMNSSGNIQFTNADKATVIVGWYVRTENKNTFKIDNQVYTATNSTKVGDYELVTVEGVAAGSHTIVRNDGEGGIYYVRVTETVSSAVKLDNPTIQLDRATGSVTITPAANAISTVYTIDGTAPSSDNGTSISGVTTISVEDGTVIKAISLGDDENYKNSDVVEETMLRTGITIATPEIKSFNGTFVITCTSPNAKIEYSTDGSTYTTYERAITLTEAKTVYAKASREDCTTSEASAEVAVLPSVNGAKTVYLSYDAFNLTKASDSNTGYSTLDGKEGNPAYGWSLELTGNNEKEYSEASNCKLTTPNGDLSAIKLSNGAANTLNIPEGKAVTKLTFYSTLNATGAVAGWKEVGETYANYAEVPMGASNDDAGKANPDVRSYNFDNATGTIVFNNGGVQLNFVIAVEYVDILNVEISDEEGYATFSSAYNVAVPDGVTAYGTEKTENNTINLVEITDGVIPAETGVILIGAKDNYTFKATTETAEVETVLTANLEDGKSLSKGDYVLGRGTNGIGFYHLNSESTLGANKAYIAAEDGAGARVAFIGFGDNTVTAIDTVVVPATAGKAYNLNGVQAAPNAKGVVIMDGKKVVLK